MFALDPAFPATSTPLTSLPLCEARLQNDRRFAGIVLVPKIEAAREIDDLSPADRNRLIEEIALAGAAVRAIGEALRRPVEKLNIGLLGNVTPQLHAHVVGRRRDDPAWPGPVWGLGAPEPYDEAELAVAVATAVGVLNRTFA